jgi:hypothetical protein
MGAPKVRCGPPAQPPTRPRPPTQPLSYIATNMKKLTKNKKPARKQSEDSGRSFSISRIASGGSNVRGIPPITKLWVKGWKSISSLTSLDLSGLTVLAGANSSGKSSFFQPTLMLKQTLEAPYDPGALLLDGPHVRFTEASQFLSKDPNSGEFAKLTVGLQTKEDLMETVYSKSFGKSIEVIAERFGLGKKEIKIRSTMSSGEIEEQLGENGKEMVKVFGREAKKTELSVARNRCFLAFQLTIDRGVDQQLSLLMDSGESGEVVRAIRSIIHLPGLRGNPERTYPLNATEGFYPGQFQSYTASLIQKWKDSANKSKLRELNLALTELGLTSEITTAPVDETRVEIKVSRLLEVDCKDFVSIADVGLAVSQVLPVLVALVVAHSGQLVFVEQPELHLHPRAQVRLAMIMARAVKRGVRILLETHSSLLLLGIQTAVANRSLSADDIALHWFTRDGSGVTCVTAAKLDESGAFGNWPEDFGDVNQKAETDYLDAAERVLLAEQNAR